MSKPQIPVSVTGGCNCASIRYTIKFPADSVWPPESNGTCQCTLCRKATGCLVPQTIGIPKRSIFPPFSASETYKTYKTSAKAERGFCSECGSSIDFQYINEPQTVEVYLGTIDEEVLLGKKTGEETVGDYGKRTTREGGLGNLICSTVRSRHIWWENAIPGVTDDMPGLKYWRDGGDGKGFEKQENIEAAGVSSDK